MKSTLSKFLVGAAIAAAVGLPLYQADVVRRQGAELAESRKRLVVAEAAQRRASREAADSARLLESTARQLARVEAAVASRPESVALAGSGTAQNPLAPAAGGPRPAEAAEAPRIEYRSAPLNPAVLTALPAAEFFAQEFSNPEGVAATWPELAKAGVTLMARAAGVAEYFSTHAVLAGLVQSLQETSILLQKDSGMNPDITQTLRSNYAATTVKLVDLARAISERPNERPDAVEVSRQIEALGNVIRSRLPTESLPQP